MRPFAYMHITVWHLLPTVTFISTPSVEFSFLCFSFGVEVVK